MVKNHNRHAVDGFVVNALAFKNAAEAVIINPLFKP
jgi:hypothetical protein